MNYFSGLLLPSLTLLATWPGMERHKTRTLATTGQLRMTMIDLLAILENLPATTMMTDHHVIETQPLDVAATLVTQRMKAGQLSNLDEAHKTKRALNAGEEGIGHAEKPRTEKSNHVAMD